VYRHPYTPTPGGATPSASVGLEEGKHELWAFFWLAILNTSVIAAAMLVAWWFVH
jgi:hypothetical protein